jgi:hypothetical protein
MMTWDTVAKIGVLLLYGCIAAVVLVGVVTFLYGVFHKPKVTRANEKE